MIKVDDLVEPRPEEIALSGLPTFFRPHESPRRRPQAARESRPARRINDHPAAKLAELLPWNWKNAPTELAA